MNCYFLRHGIAVEPEQWTGRDFDRPLTHEGIERMKCEARAIADLSLRLDVIVTSPLLRARQTAEIVADRLKLRDEIVEDKRLAEGFDVRWLSAILGERDKAEAILLVGHEPTMSATIGRIVGDAQCRAEKRGARRCRTLGCVRDSRNAHLPDSTEGSHAIGERS